MLDSSPASFTVSSEENISNQSIGASQEEYSIYERTPLAVQTSLIFNIHSKSISQLSTE